MEMEERIAAYIAHRMPAAGDVRVAALRRIPGGASRETWSFDATWQEGDSARTAGFILRRDPDASLLETDREREYQIYRALEGTGVPAPTARWLEPDPSWLDRPFFIMDRIDHCFTAPQALMDERMSHVLEPVARQKMAILARIHQLDPAALNLDVLGVPPAPDECAPRELAHWRNILAREAMEPQPVLELAAAWLAAHPPAPARRISLVHGDYRTGNFLFDRRGEIRGILDWEMAHLGDPVEDLGWLCGRTWRYRRDERVGGLLDRARAFRLYEEAGGVTVDPEAVRWWEILGNLKFAVICLTGARSFREGRTTEIMMAVVARMVPPLEVELLDLIAAR
jgi:aminoglycoside phosphotransferase (APT) family kinase protein